MKFAVTGHTHGIGLELYNRLQPNVVGFSRSNGYDITTPAGRASIIASIADCDVFINNAPAGYGQTVLAIDLFHAWKKTNKTIINVGSRIAVLGALPEHRQDLLYYQAHKLALKEISTRLASPTCRVLYRSFGYVGTERILARYPNLPTSEYITVAQAADIILSNIN